VPTPISEVGQAGRVNRVPAAAGVLVLVLCGLALTFDLTTSRPPPAAQGPAAGGPTSRGSMAHGSVAHGPAVRGSAVHESAAATALALLHDWDARRAGAYAEGSTQGLRDLYAPGSGAGAADVRLLQRYTSRGLRVTGLRMQVLALAVTERSPDRWILRVTDRLAGGVAVHASQRTPLPRDTSTTRVLTLVRGGDSRWRVSAVAEPATPARPPTGS
jgi:hypothetical protein